jgi:hypothetical protein
MREMTKGGILESIKNWAGGVHPHQLTLLIAVYDEGASFVGA